MPDASRMEVDGDTALRTTLAAAQDDLNQLDMSENAQLIEQRAKARAPKVSGTLASSIYASDIGPGKAQVASDLVYAPVIHYGWPRRNIRPQPFLDTAVTDSVPLVEANSQRDAQRILGRVRGA